MRNRDSGLNEAAAPVRSADDEEAQALVRPPKKLANGASSSQTKIGTLVFVVCAAALVIFLTNSSSSSSSMSTTSGSKMKAKNRELKCPNTVIVPENYDESFKDDYNKASDEILKKSAGKNETEFLSLLLNYSGFDGWGENYEAVKSRLYPWKSKYLVPYISDGARIFESASGVGLNLYMTLEIMHEIHPDIRNVEINGNEYIDESTKISNLLYEKFTPPYAHKGLVCTADSMKLNEFVPEESYDLVYTGYISTLLNPLNLTFGDLYENRKYYKKLCTAEEDDWRSQTLADIAQERQEEWFSRWVAEMTRIAKPGAPVIVEQVAPPFCAILHDWGGVPREWWTQAIEKYSSTWDIDPTSLIIADEKEGDKESRYNVFMRKNKKE